MYSVIAKYKGSYAVMNSETAEIEALYEKDILPLLYFGIDIKGVSFDADGAITETLEINEMTDADLNKSDEEDYDEDDYDIDIDEDDEYELTENINEELEFDDYEDEDTVDDIEIDEDEDDVIDDIYEDEDEWEDDLVVHEESTVGKLYSMLNEEQVKLLKRYYLWYSQDLFLNARKDTSMGYTDMNRLKIKQSQLNSLRNSGGQWYYAGFIDTGYDGGGYCTLGHKLRYMHVAWDVTVSDLEETFFGENYNKDIENLLDEESCIIFGIKCISDFFEVDTDCTQALQRAQRDSLKDMELIYEQYKDGVVDEVVNSFKVMDEIVDIVKKRDKRGKMFGGKNFVSVFEKNGLVEFYEQFRKLGMPVPKSLIQELRDNLIGWYSHKFSGGINYPNDKKFNITVERVFGNEFKNTNWSTNMSLKSLLYVVFQYECCGYYKYDADRNKDEGGYSRYAKYSLKELYRRADIGLLDIAEYNLDAIRKTADVLSKLKKYEGKIELSNVSQYFWGDNDEISGTDLSIKRKNYISVLESLEAGRPNLSKIPIKYRKSDRVIEYIDMALEDYNNWKEQKRREEEEKRLKKEEERRLREEQIRKNEEASANERLEIEQSKADRPAADDEVVDFLLHADVSQYINSKDFNLACNIIETVRSKGGIASSRQMWHLKRLYTEMTGRDTEGVVKERFELSSPEYEDYRKAIEFILSSGEDSNIKKVCATVNRMGTFTKKQQKYLDQAVFVYKSQA